MATSNHRTRSLASAIVAVGLLGAGAASLASAVRSSPGLRVPDRATRTAGARIAGSFSWLDPAPAPNTWTGATIASGGATLFYPSSWKPIPGDSGTVTVALRGRTGLYRGYLNVTPRQGAERLAGWAGFRTRRNTAEGDRRTRAIAAAENLHFANARGSCVIDEYRSRVGFHAYREVACLVAGGRYTNVFVGATLVRDWSTLGPVIERAASSLAER